MKLKPLQFALIALIPGIFAITIPAHKSTNHLLSKRSVSNNWLNGEITCGGKPVRFCENVDHHHYKPYEDKKYDKSYHKPDEDTKYDKSYRQKDEDTKHDKSYHKKDKGDDFEEECDDDCEEGHKYNDEEED